MLFCKACDLKASQHIKPPEDCPDCLALGVPAWLKNWVGIFCERCLVDLKEKQPLKRCEVCVTLRASRQRALA